jgi:hypothetical protein
LSLSQVVAMLSQLTRLRQGFGLTFVTFVTVERTRAWADPPFSHHHTGLSRQPGSMTKEGGCAAGQAKCPNAACTLPHSREEALASQQAQVNTSEMSLLSDRLTALTEAWVAWLHTSQGKIQPVDELQGMNRKPAPPSAKFDSPTQGEMPPTIS